MNEFSFWHDLEEGRIKISWNQTSYQVVLPKGIRGTLELGEAMYSLKEGENVFFFSN